MIPADPALVVAAARSWIGTPYHDQASVFGAGCDCLGLARGVWRQVVGPEPGQVPPYSRDWGEVSRREVLLDGAREVMLEVPIDQGAAGALVVFRMVRGAIAKHCGILTGEGTFVHAYERHGVIEERFTPGWSRRVAGVFFYPREFW